MRIVLALVLTAALAAINFLVHEFSPSPGAISGNGFHPIQFFGMLAAAIVLAAWFPTWMRVAREWAAGREPEVRRRFLIRLPLAAVALFIWAWQDFFAWEKTATYHQPGHAWGLVNQYTVGYWAYAWQAWLSLWVAALWIGILTAHRAEREQVKS